MDLEPSFLEEESALVYIFRKSMKRILIFACFIPLLTSCLIGSDHDKTRQDMEGFMERLAQEYYFDVDLRYPKSQSYQGKSMTFKSIDDNVCICTIYEEDPYNTSAKWHISAAVIITISGESKTYSIDGMVTEEEYNTRFFTLGDGIKDHNGVLRAEVFDKQGNGIGWGEVTITSDKSSVYSLTYKTGEF